MYSAAIYVYLSGRHVDNALLKLHGLVMEERGQENFLKIRVSFKCKEKNDAIFYFCRRCGTPSGLKVVFDLEMENKEKDELVAVVKTLR
jgi:hypothetical protein